MNTRQMILSRIRTRREAKLKQRQRERAIEHRYNALITPSQKAMNAAKLYRETKVMTDEQKRTRAYKLLVRAYNLLAYMEYDLTDCIEGEQIVGFRKAMWLLDIPLKLSDLSTQHGMTRYVKRE